MIVDTSALVTILREEADAVVYAQAIRQALSCRMSAANYLETAIVVDTIRNPLLSRRLDDVCEEIGLIIEPVTEAQARIAREAYRDFGRGSGHPARLNFGDCFAYALAKDKDEPLLFKGNDFSHTDIRPALR